MILHGLFLCITSFVSGGILTWACFSWRMDRDDGFLTDLLMKSYEENSRLTHESIANRTLIFELGSKALQSRSNQIKQTECIEMLTEELLKYRQQEKEQCPE